MISLCSSSKVYLCVLCGDAPVLVCVLCDPSILNTLENYKSVLITGVSSFQEIKGPFFECRE
jgi:hypothetical protein